MDVKQVIEALEWCINKEKCENNYREFEDGVIICDAFNCVCKGNKDCDNCKIMIDYTEYNNKVEGKEE